MSEEKAKNKTGPIRKKSDSSSEYFPTMLLYLEDIQEILSILSENCSEVKLEDQEYFYGSLDQLIQTRGTHPNILRIRTNDPTLHLSFSKKEFISSIHLYGSSLFGSDHEPVYLIIRKFLLNRKHWVNSLFQPFIAIFFLIVLVFWEMISRELNIPSQFYLPYILFSSLYGVFTVLMRTGFLFSIRLVKKHEEQSFWSRNRDKIILVIISSIIGAIIKTIIDNFL